jgi:hypothetical protein
MIRVNYTATRRSHMNQNPESRWDPNVLNGTSRKPMVCSTLSGPLAVLRCYIVGNSKGPKPDVVAKPNGGAKIADDDLGGNDDDDDDDDNGGAPTISALTEDAGMCFLSRYVGIHTVA